MAYSHDYGDGTRRHDPYAYSRHASPYSYSSQSHLTGMSGSAYPSGYSPYPSASYSSYASHDSYDYDPRYGSYAPPPQSPRRSAAHPPYRPKARSRRTWPPSPSAEDEKTSLEREVGGGEADDDSGAAAIPRGTVDQYPIIEEVERPNVPESTGDRRYVLVSDPVDAASASDAERRRRRKSFAERGNMAPLNTDPDRPVITERVSTPYAYTKPQKESLAPSPGEYSLSPESITPSASAVPRSVPNRDAWDAQRDQNARPPKPIPIRTRYDASPRTSKNDVFDDTDTDTDTEPNNLLRAGFERKPARYSFSKSDLNRDHLRTNLLDQQAKSDKSTSRPDTYEQRHSGSSSSSRAHTPGSQSPRSSNASLHGDRPSRRDRPAPVETSSLRTPYSEARPSRPASPLRPSSPLRHDHLPSPPRSPKLMQRPAEHPSPPRPSSRSGTPRSSSPLSSANPPKRPRVPVTAADWRATYPPVTANERPSRFSRNETMPVPAPRIDVHSPSPSRPGEPENSLPYPVDERQGGFFMPQEEVYQYDHSNTPTSPTPNLRSDYPESPGISHPPAPGTPRESSPYAYTAPASSSRYSTAPDDLQPPRSSRVRSSSIRSQRSDDGRRTPTRALSLDRPMPSCPRSSPSSEHDWYTLEGCKAFDVCPSCYQGVFADTPFATYFQPVYRYDDRFCDFSSPWMRLAWLLIIKHQRKSPDLLYQLATVAEYGQPCPKDAEMAGGLWYGIADQRDGIHVANFAVCAADVKMLEILCPTIRGYFTPLPPTDHFGYAQEKRLCALRTTSKRFPQYLDLLVELDEEAQLTNRAPEMGQFVKLARENAFKAECQRDKPLARKPWYFMPSLPEFTVCEECFDECVFPALRRGNRVATLFNRRTQLLPSEEEGVGASCYLYSPRMRKVWERVLEDEDYAYLKRKVGERKRDEKRLAKEKRELERWLEAVKLSGGPYSGREAERLKRDLRAVEEEWRGLE